MSASPAPAETEAGTSALLRTLLLCDLVGSTALVEKLGDRAAAELIRKHDRMARTVADRHGGREIDKTDGFLMMFDRPIQAVAFALDYQRGLRQLNAAEQSALAARVGIHVGDVVVWDNTPEDIAKGAKPIEVEGLVKPIASRLMNLALPGQVLLSNIAYALAHRAQGELGVQLERVRWRTYGRYRFKGIPDPIPVFEVGEDGVAPLKAPPWSGKAHREIPFWRRPATVVIEALVLALLVAIPLYSFFKPAPAIAFANRDWVVVGNLNNLTGETVFDEALESALRIALEQSRYVNVLPDLKVRDTVKRMERDPDKTRIDRAIGSEIAIRDGVKALILPTVAEVGGRVRITAEVVDPHTQTTVYSESADGVGAESILPSVDLINQRLRVRLGEALATVSQNSLPLEKVATQNIDALRAYSLGYKLNTLGRFQEAHELYRQALSVDPSFASAMLRIGIISVSSGRNDEATTAIKTALESSDRLTQRDKLYAEALLFQLQRNSDAMRKWKMLSKMYPDYFVGVGSYSYFGWRDANMFDDDVVEAAEHSASDKNAASAPGKHLLGILHLGRERFKDAEKAFEDAEAMGFQFTQYHSATAAAQRHFDIARSILERSPPLAKANNPAAFMAGAYAGAAALVDQGRSADAADHLRSLAAQSSDESVASIMRASASMVEGAPDGDRSKHVERLRIAVEQLLAARKDARPDVAEPMDALLALFATEAAGLGAMDVAKKAASSIAKTYPEYSTTYKMSRVADARIRFVEGDRDGAVGLLRSMMDGTEPYAAHVVLLDMLMSSSDWSGAIKEADWITSRRGRAYAEASSVLLPFNVEHATLSLLRTAEICARTTCGQSHRSAIETFRSYWPDASAREPFASSAQRLQQRD